METRVKQLKAYTVFLSRNCTSGIRALAMTVRTSGQITRFVLLVDPTETVIYPASELKGLVRNVRADLISVSDDEC